MFFADLSGDAREPAVAAAIAGVRTVCEEVRVLGSYRAARAPSTAAAGPGAPRDGPAGAAPR